jgi:integrase
MAQIPSLARCAPCARGSTPRRFARGPLFREVLKRRIGTRKSYTLSWFVGETPLASQSVALVVKRLTQAAGVDGDFARHSLRSGFATAAARAGKSEASIMRQTRHKSVVVVRRYIRRGTRWEDHAGAGIGL